MQLNWKILSIALLGIVPSHAQTMTDLINGTSTWNVAHRGVFLNNTSSYLVENTIGAARRASNLGYKAIEIDLKTTSNKVAIVMHDSSPSRTTNIDGSSGSTYRPMKNARVVNGDTNAELRARNWSPANTEITSLTSTQFNDQLTFLKKYDAKGSRLSNEGCSAANKCFAVLSTFFNTVKAGTYPELNDVIWVLDIQTKAQLEAAESVVQLHNFWNKVVFKVWANAATLVWDSARSTYKISTFYNKGYYVLSFSPKNVVVSNGNYIKFAQIDSAANATLLANVGVKNMITNSQNQALRVIGIETFITGINANDTTDAGVVQVRDAMTVPKWGVVRGWDAKWSQANADAETDTNMKPPKLPIGEYTFNNYSATITGSTTMTRRRNHGNAAKIRVSDIQ